MFSRGGGGGPAVFGICGTGGLDAFLPLLEMYAPGI